MKSFLALIFCLAAYAAVLPAQDGIRFEQGDWASILAKAKAEDKLIFLDAYASWCGPCKMMDRDVFSDAEVGAFFNERFINARIDMEKGEGPGLAGQYGVRAYPSLFFIDGSGEMAHTAIGYHGADQLLELGKTALKPELRISNMAARYAKGDRDPAFLYQYAKSAAASMDPFAEKILLAYLNTQEDWNTEENLQLIFETASGQEPALFDHIAKNRAALAEIYGDEVVNGQIQNLIISTIDFGSMDDQDIFRQIDEAYQKAFPDQAGLLSANFRMNYYNMTGETRKFASAAEAYLDKFGSDDPSELNNIAWAFYETIDDPKLLQKAVEWAEKSVKMENAYFNNDTVAALYYKLGNKKKARKAAQAAIKLAKENGEDYSGTQDLLDRINAM
jgi:thiol-disulfide isomerase/thioredoxin